MVLPMLAFCDSPVDPDQLPDDGTEQERPDTAVSSDTVTPEEEVVLPPEITDGSVVLACNANVHKFLTEVTYPDHDYSYSVVMDYYGGFNGKLEEGDAVKSDKPAEYSIRWTPNEAAGELTLKLSEPTWSLEQTIDAGESYVSVTNLVPNTHYSYSVTAADGTVMTEGKFDTYGSIHQVYFKHSVRNARDLGGWKTYDGKMVKAISQEAV